MAMAILISSYYLDLSGTPTYTLTLYNELVRRGHDVTIYSPKSGTLEHLMRVRTSLKEIAPPDVIIAQANVCAEEMRAMFPQVPMVFSAHGVLPELEQPPNVGAQWYTAINEDVAANLVAQGVRADRLDIVRDFVDTDRFRPVERLRDEVQQVLFISNNKKWQTYDVVNEACRKIGATFVAVGAPYGRSYEIEKEINKADLVVSTGRGILEAMSCGRPAISFNQMRGDGYLTSGIYLKSRRRNFAGDNCMYSFDAMELADEMLRYNPADGVVNRGIILDHHGHIRGVDKILEVIEKAQGEYARLHS